MQISVPGGGWEPWRLELAALNLLALGLALLALAAWAAADPARRRVAVSALLSTLTIVAVWLLAVRPEDIPTDWITIIHEGQGYKHVMQLYVRATHAEANFDFILWLIAAGGVPSLPDIVWLNLLLGMVVAVLFLHLAVHVAGWLWGVVWTAVFALNPAAFLASFSELPTHLLALYFLAGVVGWAVLDDPRHRRVVRWLAAALCLAVTVLAGLTRTESAMIGVIALALFALHALLGAARWAAATARLAALAEALLAFVAARPMLVAVLALMGVWLTQAGLPGVSRTILGGLWPFNPALYSLLFFFPMMLLPVGVSLGVLLGFVHALANFRAFGGLALSLFILVRTYFAAQDQYYETGRYLSYVFPALFLLGLYAKPQLEALIAGWRPNWARLARVLWVVAWFTRALPGVPDFYLRPEYQSGGGFAQVLLDLNSQRMVRHLVKVTRANPECVFVGRVVENFSRRHEPRQYAYAFFGGPLPEPVFVSESSATLDEAIARVVPGAACVRLYYGTDCNLTEADRCAAFVAGRRQIEVERFWSRLYDNPFDYGYAAGEVELAVYAWP